MLMLTEYLEENIISQYDNFDRGHSRKHVKGVMENAIKIATKSEHNLDLNMVVVAAVYHDVGLGYLEDSYRSRTKHHLYSGKILRDDTFINKYFTETEVEIMARACEQHRASFEGEPVNMYGKVIADADRIDGIEIWAMIKRSYRYNIDHFDQTDDEVYMNVYTHLKEKFGVNGYAYNSIYLDVTKELFGSEIKDTQEVLSNEEKFKEVYQEITGVDLRTVV